MAEVIECPECKRKLSMREEYLGQQVKCISCGNVFIAASTYRVNPVPVEAVPEPDPRRDVDRRRRDRDYDDRDDYRPRRRRRDDDERYYDEPRSPDRGAAVLTLGILGLVFCWIPLAGWALGGIALGMANSDLQGMERGRVTRDGEGATQGGKVCGLIAVILSTLFMFVYCMGFAHDGF